MPLHWSLSLNYAKWCLKYLCIAIEFIKCNVQTYMTIGYNNNNNIFNCLKSERIQV